MRDLGATAILNEMVTDPGPGAQPNAGSVRTSGGKRIDAEVVIWAGGVKPVTDFVAKS